MCQKYDFIDKESGLFIAHLEHVNNKMRNLFLQGKVRLIDIEHRDLMPYVKESYAWYLNKGYSLILEHQKSRHIMVFNDSQLFKSNNKGKAEALTK